MGFYLNKNCYYFKLHNKMGKDMNLSQDLKELLPFVHRYLLECGYKKVATQLKTMSKTKTASKSDPTLVQFYQTFKQGNNKVTGEAQKRKPDPSSSEESSDEEVKPTPAKKTKLDEPKKDEDSSDESSDESSRDEEEAPAKKAAVAKKEEPSSDEDSSSSEAETDPAKKVAAAGKKV